MLPLARLLMQALEREPRQIVHQVVGCRAAPAAIVL
jgi:hypothetical protein